MQSIEDKFDKSSSTSIEKNNGKKRKIVKDVSVSVAPPPIRISKNKSATTSFSNCSRLFSFEEGVDNKKNPKRSTIAISTPIPSNNSNNIKLSALFQKISKLYEEMPLGNDDEWRSFTYNAAAARLRHLDFEVSKDELSLQRLGKKKGFGKKFMKQIREFLYTGRCELIAQFEHDPMRLHVRNMIRIW